MKLKMTNGHKPSWLTYLTAAGIILMLIFTFTRLSDRVGTKSAGTAMLIQTVKENKIAIITNHNKTETEFKTINDTLWKHDAEIKVVIVRVDNLADKVEAQTTVTNKTNELLIELIQKMPRENGR